MTVTWPQNSVSCSVGRRRLANVQLLLAYATDVESGAAACCLSPREEGGGHGRPGDAAGAGLLALLLFLFAATAQAAQVDGETQQVETQSGGRHAAQEHQGLWREDRKWKWETSDNKPGQLFIPCGPQSKILSRAKRLNSVLSNITVYFGL